MTIINRRKTKRRKSHANLQQTNPKQNPTNNKIQRKNTNNKNPTRRRIHKRTMKKTQEELTEYLEVKTKPYKLEEPSNLLKLINLLAEHEGTTLEEINNIRKKKAEERGGFSNRVFLIKVTDN